MKLQSLTLLVFFQIGSPLAIAQSATTATTKILYSDLPKLVREKNEKVRASEIAVSAAKKRTGYLGRSFLPGVDLKAGLESATLGTAAQEQRNFWGAEARLNLYRGGRDRVEEKIRESSVLQQQSELDKDYHGELRNARKTYSQLVANTYLLNELKNALKDNEANISSAKKRSSAGVSTTSDVIQFELEQTLINQQIKKITLERDSLSKRFAIAIAQDNHEGLELSESFSHPPEPITDKTSSPQNAEIRALEQEQVIHSLKKSQSDRWWIPSLDVYSAYRRPSFFENDSRALSKDNEWVSGIQISMNLGKGFEDYANKGSQELQIQASAQKLTYMKRQNEATLHDLNQDLKLLHELIHDADKDIEKAASFLKLTKAEYSRGVKNGPDLQDAFGKYYEFKTRRIDLYRLFHEAEADLSYASGSEE